ncbi:hypothetical protein ACSBR2_012426 [Camellia fascicularis]
MKNEDISFFNYFYFFIFSKFLVCPDFCFLFFHFFFSRFLYSSLAANDPLRYNDDSSSRQVIAFVVE